MCGRYAPRDLQSRHLAYFDTKYWLVSKAVSRANKEGADLMKHIEQDGLRYILW